MNNDLTEQLINWDWIKQDTLTSWLPGLDTEENNLNVDNAQQVFEFFE